MSPVYDLLPLCRLPTPSPSKEGYLFGYPLGVVLELRQRRRVRIIVGVRDVVLRCPLLAECGHLLGDPHGTIPN